MFGGTGAVGIEALSRSAAFCRFTDLNCAPIDTIKLNLTVTDLVSRAEAKRADAFSMLASHPDRSFHYIYIAPPQYQEMWSQAVIELDSNVQWLEQDGWAIVQIHPKEFKPLDLNNLVEIDQRKYGSTLLVFFERK